MKRLSLILIAFTFMFTAASCSQDHVRASDGISSQQRVVNDFDQIEVHDAFDVTVIVDSTYDVTVTSNDNLHQYIDVSVESGMLIIELDRNLHISGDDVTLDVEVRVPSLNDVAIYGASHMTVQGTLQSSSLDLQVSGASFFTGAIETNTLRADLSGASNARINGTAEFGYIDLTGASVLEDFDLSIDVLDAQLAGASHAKLTVNNELSLKATGASSLQYRGNPVLSNIDLSGASTIQKMN